MISVEIPKRAINAAYLPHIDNMSRTQIYYGGSSSGKSVFLAQRDIIDLMNGGRNFLVCRQVGKTLRGSVVQEIKKIIVEWGLSGVLKVNKTDGTVTCSNGYQIVFAGLDDVEKLKSIVPAKGVFTDIRIEEATEANQKSVKQLMKRQRGGDKNTPKRLVLSFNPILKSHWIFTTYFSGIGWADDQNEHISDALSILKTTYKDNRFLTDDDKKDLEDETDSYFYEVYTLGNWGVLGNVIFKNWKVRDLSEMHEQFTNPRNGLDFGFSNDPAAASKTHYDTKRGIIYIYDEIYERGLTNNILADEIKIMFCDEFMGKDNEDKEVFISKSEYLENKSEFDTEFLNINPVYLGDYITCDSSEPKSIAELQLYGINAAGAVKGKDSVLHGIQWLQQQEIIIDTKCINTQNEFSQYQWKEDKDGNAMRIPVDKNNHIIDDLRYAYEGDSNSAWIMS